MKTKLVAAIAAVLILAFASVLLVNAYISAEDRQDQGNFELYRQAIENMYQIDIKGFKDRLKGGLADGKPVTAYDLEELLAGIKFEMEHTSDAFIALEIAMDHLERIPDYYSRRVKLEREVVSDTLLRN